MIIKIIFSDNTPLFVQSANSAVVKALKKTRDDDEANSILARFQGDYEVADDSGEARSAASVDLRKKKISGQKERSKEFGRKYRD